MRAVLGNKPVFVLEVFVEAPCWLSMWSWNVEGEYIKEGREEGNEKHIAQGVVLKFHDHSADTRPNDTFSEKVSVCLVDAKPPSQST
jgi:hypothetical protein